MNKHRHNYCLEKLSDAIIQLAVGEGDVRSRLHDAYMCFHTLKTNDFPEHLQTEWDWIIKSLTKEEHTLDHKGEVLHGRLRNTLWKMRNKTGRKIAMKIVMLYYRISE